MIYQFLYYVLFPQKAFASTNVADFSGLLPDSANQDVASSTISLIHAYWPILVLIMSVLIATGIVVALIYAMKHH